MKNMKFSWAGVMLMVFFISLFVPASALGTDELTLDTPNGGQNLKAGTEYNITWHLNESFDPSVVNVAYNMGGSAVYKLEYSTDSGMNYKTIDEIGYPSTSYKWKVPDITSSKARVRVSLVTCIKNFVTQQYDFSNVAIDTSDSDFTISKTITIPGNITIPKIPIQPLSVVPAAPSNLAVSVISAEEIKITWQDNSSNETGFKLEKSMGNNSAYTEIAALDANTISFNDKNVTPLTKYYYKVKAVNASGSSAYSSEVSATTPPLTQTSEPLTPQSQTPEPAQNTIIKFYVGSTDFLVNEQLQTMDASPVVIGGRTLLPIRYVATPLGATTAWDPITEKVTVTLGNNTIELWVGNNTAKLNGQDRLIDPNNPGVKPIVVPPGRTMVPLRFIGENLGCQVDWNPALQEAKLTYPQ